MFHTREGAYPPRKGETARNFGTLLPWNQDKLTPDRAMRTPRAARFFLVLACGATQCVSAQSTFSNLGFEQAQIVAGQGFASAVFSNAFPKWQGYADGLAVTSVNFNLIFLSGPSRIGIWDSSVSPEFLPAPFFKYAAYLAADGINAPNAWLAQKGVVPDLALSLRFSTTAYPLLSDPGLKPEYWRFSVLLDGQTLPYSMVNSNTNWITWAADIAGHSGQTSELRFMLESSLPGTPPGIGVAIGLDNISFSQVGIPEPSNFFLLSVGGVLAVALRLLCNRKPKRGHTQRERSRDETGFEPL
jgi:hypothetical protein